MSNAEEIARSNSLFYSYLTPVYVFQYVPSVRSDAYFALMEHIGRHIFQSLFFTMYRTTFTYYTNMH